MAARNALRSDAEADKARRKARRSRDAAQARQLLALATVHDVGPHSAAAGVGGVMWRIMRDWSSSGAVVSSAKSLSAASGISTS